MPALFGVAGNSDTFTKTVSKASHLSVRAEADAADKRLQVRLQNVFRQEQLPLPFLLFENGLAEKLIQEPRVAFLYEADGLDLLLHEGDQAYFRKMAIDGYILVVDRSDTKAYIRELQAVSRNINQIAKRANATGTVYRQDIEDIKKAVDEIWRLQRRTLLNQP